MEEQEWAGREGRLQRLREVNHVIFFPKVTLMALSLSLKQWKAFRRLKKVEV